MLETITYIDKNGLECPVRVRRKDGEVWFHLRDLRTCLNVEKQPIMFHAVNVQKFNDEVHVNVTGVKCLLDACETFDASQHFIRWFRSTVLGQN